MSTSTTPSPPLQSFDASLFTKLTSPAAARVVLALVLLWIAMSAVWPGAPSASKAWLLSWKPNAAAAHRQVDLGLAGLQMLGAVALLLPRLSVQRAGASLVAALYLGSLGLLLLPRAWMAELGGFPAIGAGQGVLKHLAIGALALQLRAASSSAFTERLGRWGVVTVLLWIGAMKFTAPEAKGIVELVASHPLMAWMYDWGGVQAVSNAIGVIELATAALLLSPNLSLRAAGVAFAWITFAITLSFLFTAGGWLAKAPPGLLDPSGRFLVKDLLLALALLPTWRMLQPPVR